MKETIKVIGVILMLVIAFIIMPSLAALVGWLAGYFVELLLGGRVIDWLNLTLGTARFHAGDLPKVTAVITMLAYIFSAHGLVGKGRG